jgi:hypothetical protein
MGIFGPRSGLLSGLTIGNSCQFSPSRLENSAERLTTLIEYDNNGSRTGWRFGKLRPEQLRVDPLCNRGPKIPPGEDGMEIEKDNFEDDNELSRLEDDEELPGETEEIVEAEEEELVIVGEEPEEEAPAPKPAPKPAAKKPAKKAAKKKAAPKKKTKKSKPKKKAAKKKAKKAGKKKKKR